MENSKLLVLLFLLLQSVLVQAQPFSATLDARLMNLQGPKAVVLTYDDGEVAFLKSFSDAPFGQNFVVELRQDPGRKLNLTFLHETPAYKSPNNLPFFKATTYFHLPSGIRISNMPGNMEEELKPVKLHFKNVKSVQDVVVDNPRTGRERGTRFATGGLVLNYDKSTHDDVFVALRANREDGFRYFYRSAGEPVPGEINFNELPFNVTSAVVTPPFGSTVYHIRAKNEDSGNGCLLFNFNQGAQQPGNVPEVFLPGTFGWYDFFLWVRSENTITNKETKICSDNFYYAIQSDTLPLTWPTHESTFDFGFFQSDRRSFALQLQQPSDAWRLGFRMPITQGQPTPGNVFSTWDVVGSGEGSASWKLPVLPEELVKSMPSIVGFEPELLLNVQVQRSDSHFWDQPGQFFDLPQNQSASTLRREKLFGCGWRK